MKFWVGKVTVKLWKSGEIPDCTEIINRAADRRDVGVRERKQQDTLRLLVCITPWTDILYNPGRKKMEYY